MQTLSGFVLPVMMVRIFQVGFSYQITRSLSTTTMSGLPSPFTSQTWTAYPILRSVAISL